MTRIAYVIPANIVGASDQVIPPCMPMLGIAYLSAYLQKHAPGEFQEIAIDCMLEAGTEVKPQGTIGIHGIAADQVIGLLRKDDPNYKPDIIAISAVSSKIKSVLKDYILRFRQVFPDACIVVGGNHVGIEKGALLIEFPELDFCVTGEGEVTFFELARTVGASKTGPERLSTIDGLIYRNNGVVTENAPRALIENLDEIPFPNWSLFDMERYFANARKYHRESYNMRVPVLPMVTSRGCPFRCTFCAFPLIWGKQAKWRARSPENVVSEMKHLITRFNIREIHFMDDNINVHKPRFIELCTRIINSGLRIKWAAVSGIGIKGLDREVLTLMKRSGAYRFVVGFESGSENTTRYIKRKYDREEGLSAIREAKRLGFWTGGNFMIGFPYETAEDMRATKELAMQSGVDFLALSIATPYPGTKMRDDFIKEGLLVDSFEADQFYGGWNLVHLSKNDVQSYSNRAQKTFLIKKLSLGTVMDILRKIHSWEDVVYTVQVMNKMLRIVLSGIFSGRFSYVAGWSGSRPSVAGKNGLIAIGSRRSP